MDEGKQVWALVPPYYLDSYKATITVSVIYGVYTSYEKAEAARAALAKADGDEAFFVRECTIQTVPVDPANEHLISTYFRRD